MNWIGWNFPTMLAYLGLAIAVSALLILGLVALGAKALDEDGHY